MVHLAVPDPPQRVLSHGEVRAVFQEWRRGVLHRTLEDHETSYNDFHDLGALGIFNHGSAGARIHDNTIDGTTLCNEPESLNGVENTFGMSLGGYCSDGNEYSDNTITNMAGIAISWDASPETVQCNPSGCTPVSEDVNVIQNTTISGTCLEKDAAPGTQASTRMARSRLRAWRRGRCR